MGTDLELTQDMIVVLGLVVFTMTMFMFPRIRSDATALVVLVALGVSRIVPADELFSGFSGNAVISIIATMILGAGLDHTGALHRLAAWLLRRSRGAEERLIAWTSGVAGVMSGFMQNPSVTALFLPVASRLSGRTGVPLGRMLFPLSAAIIMGGGLTMVGNSPLLLLNDLVVSANRNLPSGAATLAPFPMFQPLPIGLALLPGSEARLSPAADQMLWVGSVIGVLGRRETVQAYADANQLKLSARLRNFGDLFDPNRAGISEAVVPPTSQFIGRTQSQLRLRKRFGISLLAINRDKKVLRADIRELPLRAGDMLVFHSFWSDLGQAGVTRDFVVVTDYPKQEQRPHKLRWALGLFVASMFLALTTLLPVPVALMGGAAAMIVAGVLNMDEAYSAVNWKTVFLMACLIPLGWAMDSTGAANWVAQQAIAAAGPSVPGWVLQAVAVVEQADGWLRLG